MFIKTFKEEKCEELKNMGFKFICEQDFGITKCYVFEFKPSFYAFFNNTDTKEYIVSNEMFI